MNRLEILLATARRYTISTRAVKGSADDPGGCVYRDSNTGRMCAFGFYMTEEAKARWEDMCMVTLDMLARGGTLDQNLIPEVHGHSYEFWRSVQDFHDTPHYWDKTGLSLDGWSKLSELIYQYSGEGRSPMAEPVKCYVRERGTSNIRWYDSTPAVAVPIDLLERLVDDSYHLSRDNGSVCRVPYTERDTLEVLIRELREEG